MGKAKRRRRGLMVVLRAAMGAATGFGLLVALLVLAAFGNPAWGLLALPMAMLAGLIVVPILLFALLMVALSLALPVALLTGIFGAPAYLFLRVIGWRRGSFGRASRGQDRWDGDQDGWETPLATDELLRRRYVAGQLSYQAFQSGMIGVLRDRFARGEIKLAEYEAELDRLLAPARHLDVARDPALAAAWRS